METSFKLPSRLISTSFPTLWVKISFLQRLLLGLEGPICVFLWGLFILLLLFYSSQIKTIRGEIRREWEKRDCFEQYGIMEALGASLMQTHSNYLPTTRPCFPTGVTKEVCMWEACVFFSEPNVWWTWAGVWLRLFVSIKVLEGMR